MRRLEACCCAHKRWERHPKLCWCVVSPTSATLLLNRALCQPTSPTLLCWPWGHMSTSPVCQCASAKYSSSDSRRCRGLPLPPAASDAARSASWVCRPAVLSPALMRTAQSPPGPLPSDARFTCRQAGANSRQDTKVAVQTAGDMRMPTTKTPQRCCRMVGAR